MKAPVNIDDSPRCMVQGALHSLTRIFNQDRDFRPLLALIDANDANRGCWPDDYPTQNPVAVSEAPATYFRLLGSGS